MPEPVVEVYLVVGQPPGDDMAEVHRAAAEVAYAHIFSSPFPMAEAREKWTGHQGRVWLARRGATLVGFATAADDQLDGLYVLPSESGRGIGSALMDAIGDVRQLWVLEENRTGRAWYERRGWRHTGRRQQAYGVWELLYER